MGPELRTGLTSAHLVQLAFPALQDLPVLAPPPERSFTELIVAPEVALTKLPAANGAMATKTDPAPVLSPSQVRCFFECQARWWFKYGLQLPERNSSLALGLAVHQALEVNFRQKIETREDLETRRVLFRSGAIELPCPAGIAGPCTADGKFVHRADSGAGGGTHEITRDKWRDCN